jgi:hypothetical protein
MEEYAETIDFPVKWDSGAPMPHLVANGYRTFLLFYLKDNDPNGVGPEFIALVQFHSCISAKLGTPNEDVLHSHPLFEKGLKPYTAQIIRNSKWREELESINQAHSDYNSEFWRSLNHYVFWFHDETFECIAKSYEVELFQKSIEEVFGEAAKRILA